MPTKVNKGYDLIVVGSGAADTQTPFMTPAPFTKTRRLAVLGALCASVLTAPLHAGFPPDQLGLQLFSLRKQAAKDMPGALDQAKAFGLTNLEIAGTGSLPVADLVREAQQRGLKLIGAHIPIARLQSDLAGVVAEAKQLGVAYVLCSIPRPVIQLIKDEATVRHYAEGFNRWGRALGEAGVRLGFHTHGGEFVVVNAAGDTLLDILVRHTDPAVVTLQMDVFWVFGAGQNPAQLLRKYPGRWELMHLKDLRLGVPVGPGVPRPGHADNVPVGQGQIDWVPTLAAAREAGIKFYFIEDESETPVENVPQTIRHLDTLSARR